MMLSGGSMKLDRKYYRYEKWEDFSSGMYSVVSPKEREIILPRAIEFMGNIKLFESFMKRVVVEWPHSSEHNLSSKSSNRRAWIGQASCAMALVCPEDVTREAWGMIGEQKRILANRAADRVIKKWEKRYESEGWQIYFNLGESRLHGRNT